MSSEGFAAVAQNTVDLPKNIFIGVTCWLYGTKRKIAGENRDSGPPLFRIFLLPYM
jgi:hypothetical protein